VFGPDKPVVRRAARYPAIAVALLWLCAGAGLAAPAGTVVGLGGECVVESGGGTRTALKLGQPVEIGDIVDIPADGKLKLRMVDGSVISLAAGTRMTIAAYAADSTGRRQDARLSLIQGLLRAVVAPVEHPANFEVDTAAGTAAVRSTDWFVEASATEMRVRVLRGSVALTSAATKRSETIRAHWAGRLEAGHDPAPPRILRRSEFNALIARTGVAQGEERPRAPVRAHAAGPDRGRRGQHRRAVERRPSEHRPEEVRPGRETPHEHPQGHEREGEGRHGK
jgi:hypothetical protein